MFYFWGTLCAMLIPLPMIAVAYFVNVLLMRFTRIFKNKNLITAIGAAIGIFLSFGFNYLIQSSTKHGVDFAAMRVLHRKLHFSKHSALFIRQ